MGEFLQGMEAGEISEQIRSQKEPSRQELRKILPVDLQLKFIQKKLGGEKWDFGGELWQRRHSQDKEDEAFFNVLRSHSKERLGKLSPEEKAVIIQESRNAQAKEREAIAEAIEGQIRIKQVLDKFAKKGRWDDYISLFGKAVEAGVIPDPQNYQETIRQGLDTCAKEGWWSYYISLLSKAVEAGVIKDPQNYQETIRQGLDKCAKEGRWYDYISLLSKAVEAGVIGVKSKKVAKLKEILASSGEERDQDYLLLSLAERLRYGDDAQMVWLNDLPLFKLWQNRFQEINTNMTPEKKVEDINHWFKQNENTLAQLAALNTNLARQLVLVLAKRGLPFVQANLKVFAPALENTAIKKNIREYLTKATSFDGQSLAQLLEIASAYQRMGQKELFVNLLQEGQGEWKKDKLRLNQELLKLLASQLEIKIDVSAQELGKWQLEYFANLLTNQEMLKNDKDNLELYRGILKACFEDRFFDFISNPEQKDQLGQEIALHNQKVKEDFEKAGIDWKTWQEFDKEGIVQVSTAKKSDREALFKQFEDRLKMCQETLSQAESRLGQSLNKDLAQLAQKKKEFDPTKIDLTDPDWLSKLLPTYHNSLNYLKNKNPHFTLPPEVEESFSHLKETIKQLTTEAAKEQTAVKELIVRKWQRDPRRDLFQGNHTHCCIAVGVKEPPPGGGLTTLHPETILQYLIDQGIQVAEVIDPETDRPVAQTWLFVSLDNNGRPVLVADNFEVNSRYPAGANVNRAIKEAMFRFLERYAQSANIPQVVLGNVATNDVETSDLPHATLPPIKKLGGYYHNEKYYLEALEQTNPCMIR